MLRLQRQSIDWALKHALAHGDTDVFPVPFEYEALKHDWDRVGAELQQADALSWVTRPSRVLLAPKARHGFRVITQLDPLDFLVFAACVREIASDLEACRVPPADGRVFSYRVSLDGDGRLFDPEIGYRSFLQRAREKLDERPDADYVAVTDISDFYSRIYHHRLENALASAAVSKKNHVKAIMGLLSGWNNSETYGIPIGSAPARLLAEVVLADVDQALLAAGIDFIRFNDDYRIFSDSYASAYSATAFLADTLSRNHGLGLQQKKTNILDRATFTEEYLKTAQDHEFTSLRDRFMAIIAELGLDNPYEPIDYDELPEHHRNAVDSLNLEQLLRDELGQDEPDFTVVRFALRRLGQFGNANVVDDVLASLDRVHPALPDICGHIAGLRSLDDDARARLGAQLLDLMSGSVVSALPYHRMWILEIFSRSNAWGNSHKFYSLFAAEPHDACRRNLILAMGRAGMRHWFQSQWRSLLDHPDWTRRAVLAGTSCLENDARRHLHASIARKLDPILEIAVSKWALSNPF